MTQPINPEAIRNHLWSSIAHQTRQIVEEEQKKQSESPEGQYWKMQSLGKEKGFITSCGPTNVKYEGFPLPANFVGNRWTGYQVVATAAPTTPELGDLIARRLQQGSALVIDLRNPSEDASSREKKAYWPIQFVSERILPHLTKYNGDPLTTLTIPPQINNSRVVRYRFSNWPDGGTIPLADLDHLVRLVDRLFKKRQETHPSAELWIHCRGGVGRTGTLVTAMALRKQIVENPPKKNHDEWVSDKLTEMILSMRRERSSWFVQTPEQFELLYRYGHDLLSSFPSQ